MCCARGGKFAVHAALVERLLAEAAARMGTPLDALLPLHLAGCSWSRGAGSTSYWVSCPDGVDSGELAEAARKQGVVIEPGDVFFMTEGANRRCFRLGFSSIRTDRIEAGIERLGRLIAGLGRRSSIAPVRSTP